jgi:hypothetical protein
MFSEFKKIKTGVVVHICSPSYLGGGDRRILLQRPAWEKAKDPI